MSDRLYALKTISHEWFHAARTPGSVRVNAFEEGAADVFSEEMVRGATKTTVQLQHTYGPLAEGVRLLTERFGKEILVNSRSAKNQADYLRNLLKRHGYSEAGISRVVQGISDINNDLYYSSWLKNVKDLLNEKR